MLLRSGDTLLPSIQSFVKENSDVHIFSPYVKLDALQLLLNGSPCKVLVVRWEIGDLVDGASDLKVFEYCQENNITLYRNAKLHLKAYVGDHELIVTTANVSERGLAIREQQANGNYELGCVIEKLTLADRLYFRRIITESTLITDSLYRELQQKVQAIQPRSLGDVAWEFPRSSFDKSFLISSLPMTWNPKTLQRICETGEALSDVEMNCAIHDLALYNIPLGLSGNAMTQHLREAFFKHPFIVAFLSNLEQEREVYFGQAKAWIQANCADVPTPRRWEITTNLQILYRWIVDLSDGKYRVDQPNVSERLYINQ